MQIYKFSTLDDVMAQVVPTEPMAFDIETIQKYGKIRSAQFYQAHWEQVLIVEYPDPLLLMLKLSVLTECTLVMQYATYEVSTIQDWTGSRWAPHKWDDTLLLARLALPHLLEYDLGSLLTYTLGYDPYLQQLINKTLMQKADWSATVLPDKQWLYAALDVYLLLGLYDKIKEHKETTSYKLDHSFLSKCFEFQRVGMPVDEKRRVDMYSANLKRVEEIALPINCNSYQQVRKYIDSTMSDDLGLAKLSLQGNARAIEVRETRKLIKQNSFLDKFATDTGYIYGKFGPYARSGRATCSDQNLQQLPRKTKSVFGHEVGGDRVMLYSDYSQLELRGIGSITNEVTMIELYRNGEDLHNYVAAQIFGPDFTPTQRQIAKTCNFNLLYGGGVGMFQSILIKDANIFMHEDDLMRIIRKWKRLFPAIAAWQERGIRNFRRGAFGSTPFGRKYKANMMTDQLNIENQGFGAEVAKLATHYVYDDLKSYEAEMNNFIHDSYLISMPNDQGMYEGCAKRLGEAMREAWHEACKMVTVKDMPMPVKVDVGYNWGDIEAGKIEYRYSVG